MPYNTRRKSLSLSELGIAIPKRARSGTHLTSPENVVDADVPPVKKAKRSHRDSASPPPTGLMSPPRTNNIRVKDAGPLPAAELSPPPSPQARGYNKVDVEGIHDDIVVATIRQLEMTGNRPLFIKELGAILARSLACVEKSANPTALISSRLTQYLGRSWPAISPCPLAKDLSTAHPRRLYFYLTTLPRRPVPDFVDTVPEIQRIISPSLSSASAVDEDELCSRQRSALSPSPEVDLSSPELDEESEPSASLGQRFTGRNSPTRASSTPSHGWDGRRAASPQLEKEERDFKQTANALYEQAQQRRKSSQSQDVVMDDTELINEDVESVTLSIEGECGVNDATKLFGHFESSSRQPMGFSSPVIRPQMPSANVVKLTKGPGFDRGCVGSGLSSRTEDDIPDEHMSLDEQQTSQEAVLHETPYGWEPLQSPENIAMDELDDMFEAY